MLADLRGWALANLRYASDLILPPVCIHCHRPVASHGVLCAACWRDIQFITPPVCGRLGLPLPYAETPSISAMALRHPPLYGRARAAARFDGVMRRLIHSFKYADRHEAASFFARLMHAAGGELIRDAEILMPVPLHRGRLWKRRYNQAAILAKRLAANTGLPLDLSGLRRVRQTPSQVGLSSHERRENVAAAFAVGRGAAARLRGKRVLLIDDVITTGSTLGACAQVLKDAGAAEVDCLALAMVVGPAIRAA
ncbi:MAG: ComF family protein [Rhodomicrobiaceae bacterium]